MSSFPETRLRRLRRTGALRSLVRETKLDRSDFVYPLFVGPSSQANDELPALGRFSVEDLPREAEELLALGLSAVILFGIPEEKDDEGSGAYASDGVVQRALRGLRERYPGSRPDHGRLSLRVHVARALRRDRERRGGKRRHAGAARPDRGQPRRGRRRRRGAERHDGRAGRGAPGRARRGRLRGDGDHLVRRQVRLRLLRAVPRGGGVGSVLRRPSRVPDGSRERARGAPRVRARRGGGCGRADHQAGAPESRRDPRRSRVASTCPSPPTTSPASTRW